MTMKYFKKHDNAALKVTLLAVALALGSFQTLKAQEVFLEAESASLTAGAHKEACASCSGGFKVAGLGDLLNGTATFSVSAPGAGLYPISVYFVVSDDRSLNVRVNNEDMPQKVIFRRIAPKDQASRQVIYVRLKSGLNKVSFDNPVEGGPELDKIGFTSAAIKALNFKGTLKDKAGKPVANATVHISGAFEQIVKTDAGGNYLISNVPNGAYLINVFAAGKIFSPHTKAVGAKEAQTAVNFTGENISKNTADVKTLKGDSSFLNYNIRTGLADFYIKGKMILANVYGEAHVPAVISSTDYSHHELKKDEFTDKTGSGTLFTIISTGRGLPEMTQEYWLYSRTHFILTRVSVKSDQALNVNYIAPIKSETPVSVLPASNNYSLFVPFDNDKWVRYVAFPFKNTVSSHEVSVLFNTGAGQGIVLGSVDHDTWKTGVITATTGSSLNRVEVYGGFTYATTRDVLPHGSVVNNTVQSPRVFIGNYPDWRQGMNDYAAVNSGLHTRLKWPGGAPFGWNSWGKLQFKLTGKKAVEVSDFFAKELKPRSFENDGIAYIGLDAGAENRTDEELTAFVNECRKNGQVPGAYYGPFADWGGDSTKTIEGTSYTFKDLYLRAHGNRQFIDGSAALDPTHPGTKARIKKSLERFKRLGFKFMKVDFLTHASLEADKHFNPKVTTGVQAYNEGMQFIRETLGDSIYLNQAISPIFPASYAQSRRIACDVFGDSEKIEYAMNALTYGWWLSNVYLYNDADHVVLEGYSEAENRSRVTSSVTTGIFIAGDDFSADGLAAGKARALQFLTNRDVNDIARSGRSFEPLFAAAGGKAADAFIRKDDRYFYLALFNYGKENKEFNIPLNAIKGIQFKNHNFKELWTGKEGNAGGGIQETIPAEDVRLLRFDLQ